MKLHLRMLAKSIQIVFLGFLTLVLVALIMIASVSYVQYRVDVNMARQEMVEQVLEVVK